MPRVPLINISDYTVDHVTFEPLPDYTEAEPVACSISVSFRAERQPENNQFFRVLALFKFDTADMEPDAVPKPNAPCKAAIAITGYFVTAVALPDGEMFPAVVVSNAMQIIYGVARGVIGSVTASLASGKLVIPTVQFEEMVLKAPNVVAIDVMKTESTLPDDPAPTI